MLLLSTMKSYLVATIYIILLSMMFGGASLLRINPEYLPSVSQLRYMLFLVPLIVFILVFFLRYSYIRFGKMTLPFWFWLLFACTVIITATIKADAGFLIDGFWFFLGVPLVFFIILPQILKENANKFIAAALFIGHAPYIIITILEQPVSSNFLRIGFSVFNNPNGLGSVAGACALGLIILIYYSLERRHLGGLIYFYALVIILLLVMGIILFSRARTPLLALLIAIGSILITAKPKIQRITKAISVLLFFLGTAFLFRGELLIELIQSMQDKFEEKSTDLLSGRLDIWSYVFRNTNIIGYGEDFFDPLGRGAHNSFLNVLAFHGVIAVLFFVLFFLSSIFYSYQYSKRNRKTPYGIVPFVIIIFYGAVSFATGKFGNIGSGITIAFFLSVGVVIKNFGKRAKKVKNTTPVRNMPVHPLSKDIVTRS